MTISKEEIDKTLNNEGNYESYSKVIIKYLNKENRINDIKIENDKEIKSNASKVNIPKVSTIGIKNIILYGAPGVGKTHNYQNLISMIENNTSQNEIFDTISNNIHVELNNDTFQKIKDEKRVEFVTFHQSYSYEDFIEGFRPNESGNIELEDGIFKQISDEAKTNLDNSSKNKNNGFESILNQFQLDFESGTKLKTYNNTNEFDIAKYTAKSIHINVNDNKFSISYIPLEKIYNSNKVKQINTPQDVIKALDGQFKGLATYYFSIFRELIKYKEIEKETIDLRNYYIVIDEINRGNISKIFGELITLIEEDKRDEYAVTLPYSKEPFRVPSNLYIIATMNSTDKSIATIDIALRRRFTFLKMKPNLTLVKDNKAREMMEKLNIYITKNLGEDYQLGHSYFMKVQNDDLEFVKEYKIKPLLEEYFYADEKSADDILDEVFKN
ncbi:MAG: AAA family ATPase [Sulfurimonas sp.]|nr:AAA family ATPase [Sulfurimonas sp.]MCW9068216.1 AAA family ATPase [Sulfurimonas sp.]